jgi:hypothetical protein
MARVRGSRGGLPPLEGHQSCGLTAVIRWHSTSRMRSSSFDPGSVDFPRVLPGQILNAFKRPFPPRGIAARRSLCPTAQTTGGTSRRAYLLNRTRVGSGKRYGAKSGCRPGRHSHPRSSPFLPHCTPPESLPESPDSWERWTHDRRFAHFFPNLLKSLDRGFVKSASSPL